jgi:hypothetical protein
MDNTIFIDSSLVVLAFGAGWLLTYNWYLNRLTSIKRLPLFLVSTAALWSLFNWLTHIIAVLVVNFNRMLADTFVYTFHFYSMILMGITFTALSAYQLSRIRLLSKGKHGVHDQLVLVSWSIILLSLPIFPLNPIGLLPVLSSSIILITVIATKRQWKPTAFETKEKITVSA